MIKKLLIGSAMTAMTFAATAHNHASTDNAFNPDTQRIKSHLFFLADDLLEGRDTGSRGHEIAALYIATEFAKYGLKPAGTDGYMQNVAFRKANLVQESPKFTFTQNGETVDFDYPKEYLASPSLLSTEANVKGEMVFVGYGIVADELSHNDYEDLDVKGKVVVALAGKPSDFPSEEGAHFASGYQKQKYAVDNGAIGMITITTPKNEKVRPYQSRLNYIHTPRMAWLDDSGQPANSFSQLKGGAYMSEGAARKLFEGAEKSLDDVYAQLEADKVPQGFALNGVVDISKTSVHDTITSPNVVGVLEGSDPELKNEYVVFSAHSDHIGFAKTVKKDNINNGAMDNASGTSVMLETARLFSEMEEKPKRSILFVSVTGEEKGLLGADYFARNPTVPVTSMVANVNLDMPILTYEFADVIAFGANHSDLQESVEKAAANANIELSPDPWPEQALFTRSDHYAFVKQGVPSVFMVPGLKSKDPNVDGSKVFGQFLSTHYHKPSDDINQPFNWNAAETFTKVNAQIGWTLANQKNKPKWNDGDFFGNTFSK
ncbi:M28 family metallopeptidase [Alteromonas macleodii]|uniref:M42 glutamyl aminopeptidase family protein n=2 Tax=Alteromonas TaxID=226 RepID=A0AB36FXF4_ALTMA|nr:M28 family metallopeptidase [Alteromonas macleodii]MCP4058011.1 M28 family peptidase [Pseudoalteromonas sp.]OES37754.1 M42 glutamyl aminopeptidase family protein [Alteromonas macleodii]OES38028.1 M42 glutamyl aminopeptidase family protein [Alteromonas macleodii]OES38194.1 M42 glutamyl aminopeptidase family protein [Alteromonas macleodii]OES43159.1 M42 glutamyl aminopeptidase family protein [Alteromonas macleodii]|tara:strand:+ start:1683 stop:3320 length:1638 start_codon:yes stop_codon:yes gene_type:complete